MDSPRTRGIGAERAVPGPIPKLGSSYIQLPSRPTVDRSRRWSQTRVAPQLTTTDTLPGPPRSCHGRFSGLADYRWIGACSGLTAIEKQSLDICKPDFVEHMMMRGLSQGATHLVRASTDGPPAVGTLLPDERGVISGEKFRRPRRYAGRTTYCGRSWLVRPGHRLASRSSPRPC